MIEEEGVDGVCIGEGEHAMLDLVTHLAEGKPVTGIQNWWVKDNGTIHRNPLRPLIESLDELPVPDHDVFLDAMIGPPLQAIVITSRGCPHKCTYCFNHIYHELYRGKGPLVRRRSVGHVMRELRRIKATNCRFIRFNDDMFILSRDWIEEFSEAYREQIGLPFSCLVRANCVTQETVSLLKRAGCYRIMMGVEAGNDHVRREILKRDMSDETILEAARIVRQAGLRLVTANLAAIPGGSLEADWETVRLNARCRPNFASVSLLQPYPRTKIYQYAEENGLVDAQQLTAIGASFGFGFTSPLKLQPEEKARMENLQKFFFIAVRFPWLVPLVRRLIRLPPNRLFVIIYLLSVNYGMHFVEVPMRVGLALLWRRTRWYRLLAARVRARGRAPAREPAERGAGQ